MKTAALIINLLNRKTQTVNELAGQLGLTRNSVHLQIGKLEAAGLVQRVQLRKAASAGKPAMEYRTTPGSEDAFSQAYKPLLASLIQVLAEELDDRRRGELLRRTGRELARNAGLQPGGDLRSDLNRAVDAVNALGALAEIDQENHALTVTSYSCPAATLVRTEAGTCDLVGAFFSQATGKPVTTRCATDHSLVCRFTISTQADQCQGAANGMLHTARNSGR